MPTDYLGQAGVQLPGYYRSTDQGVSQFNYFKDSMANATAQSPFKSDLTDLLVLKNLNGSSDPFFLNTLTNLATGPNIDQGTQALANRQLYSVNQERQKNGLKTIDAPGAAGFNESQPTFNGVNPGNAPVAPSPTYTVAPPDPFTTKSPVEPTYSGTLAQQTQQKATYTTAYNAWKAQRDAYDSSVTAWQNNKASYLSSLPGLTSQYNSQLSTYNTQKSAYDSSLSQYQTNLAGYTQRKTAADALAQASDATLAASQSGADQISKGIVAKTQADEQARKLDLLKFSLQGVSRFFAGRAATTITPSQVVTKKPTLGGN